VTIPATEPAMRPPEPITIDGPIPKASLRDSVAVFLEVLLPTIAKGPVIRRPRMVALSERLDLDRKAVRRMQRIRARYGDGPLRIHFPIGERALILSPEHVHRVLEQSPEPFATASMEKVGALTHFEPKNALISHGAERAERRRFNEEVLESDRPAHHLADSFLQVVDEEAETILAGARQRGELTWDDFASGWFRLVRRIVLGNGAADDHELTELQDTLRSDANWAMFRPKRTGLRETFFARLRDHLARAEPGSLAAVMAETHATDETAPSHQTPQWLFAFDPAGMNTFRALALLVSHPEQLERARQEIRSREGTSREYLPFLRATILESLRLWPTTPMVLRETTRKTTWETGTMAPKTGILIFAPFLHRDDRRLPYADRFTPDLWLEERTREDWPLIPFSAGPAICPGRNLVLLVSSAMLAALLDDRQITLRSHQLHPTRPMPAILDNYALRFAVGG
jgi:cytochrome P450